MLSKKIVFPVIAATVISGSTLFVTTQVHAQSPANNPLSGLVQMIAQKFNLDQNQVQAVVTQYQQQQKQNMQQNMQQRLKTRLDQAVKNGKLTSTQETAILNEISQLQSKYSSQSLKGMTPEARMQAMQNEENDLKSWAQSQGINPNYVMILPKFGMHGAWGKHKITATPTPTPS